MKLYVKVQRFQDRPDEFNNRRCHISQSDLPPDLWPPDFRLWLGCKSLGQLCARTTEYRPSALHKFISQKLKMFKSRNAQEDWKSKGKRCDARMLWRDGPWTWSMQDAAFLFRELVDAPFDPGTCSPLLFFVSCCIRRGGQIGNVETDVLGSQRQRATGLY